MQTSYTIPRVFNSIVIPGRGATKGSGRVGLGGYGGLQGSVSNASTPGDLAGPSADYGAGGGTGYGGGGDLSIGAGTRGQTVWQASATGGGGWGGYAHGLSTVNNVIVPFCGNF